MTKPFEFFISILFLSASVAVAQQSPSPPESERLRTWLDEVFRQELAHSPMGQTYLGMILDPAAYGKWDDFSDSAEVARYEREQGYLAHLREHFDPVKMDEEGRLSYRFAEYEWESAARSYRVRKSEYVFSPIADAVSRLTTFLINNHRVSERAHADAYLSRLRGVGAVIDELVAKAERRAEAGVRLPLFAYPRLIESARTLISAAPFVEGGEEGALLNDFKTKVNELDVSQEDREKLIADAESALREVYRPAIERYIAALRRMEKHADDRAGAWKLPEGEEFYAVSLAFFTTRDELSADEIHAIGLSEVARIHDEMREIMRAVGFQASLQAFFDFLRTDPQFQYPNNEEGRRRYLDESTRFIDQVMEAAPRFFNVLPKADLEVRAVEEYREATATGAFYNRPALDGSRPGYYYVNLANMADNPTYLMESLAYHEGAPGHHFQIALAQELEGVPLLQRLAWYPAYSEGWGLYAEHLAKDMGFYTDPYQDFGRLSHELFRAVRLVVDTGIHHERWTREEALEYMLDNTPMTEGELIPEVERYIVWPGQAVSYKIGMMTILELRDRARAELGERFPWGGFHDAVLTAGPLPLPLLTERVDAWIDATR